MDAFPKEESEYPNRDFALRQGTEQTFLLPYANPNTAAARNQTWHMARHHAATRTQADWNSVYPLRNPGVRCAPD